MYLKEVKKKNKNKGSVLFYIILSYRKKNIRFLLCKPELYIRIIELIEFLF